MFSSSVLALLEQVFWVGSVSATCTPANFSCIFGQFRFVAMCVSIFGCTLSGFHCIRLKHDGLLRLGTIGSKITAQHPEWLPVCDWGFVMTYVFLWLIMTNFIVVDIQIAYSVVHISYLGVRETGQGCSSLQKILSHCQQCRQADSDWCSQRVFTYWCFNYKGIHLYYWC